MNTFQLTYKLYAATDLIRPVQTGCLCGPARQPLRNQVAEIARGHGLHIVSSFMERTQTVAA